MPRVRICAEKYYIKDAFDNLRWECKRYGFTQAEQGKILGIGAQAVSNAYRKHTLSYSQYLLIKQELERRKEKAQ